jgi:hypothetical protein
VPRRNANARKVHRGRSSTKLRETLAYVQPDEFVLRSVRGGRVQFSRRRKKKEPSDAAA